MNVLLELSRREAELLQRVGQARGLMEEKTAEIRAAGIFDAYRDIHLDYIGLLKDPAARLEATKRALFLSWYEVSEPPCFTGVAELSPEATRQVLERVEQLVAEGELDSELQWMLPYYHSSTDFLIDLQPDLPLLKAWLTEADTQLFCRIKVPVEAFHDRGQMGVYWVSVMQSPAR